jgi:hypothetical protein
MILGLFEKKIIIIILLHYRYSEFQTITTAVEDIDKKEPTKMPSDNLAPHNYMKKHLYINM